MEISTGSTVDTIWFLVFIVFLVIPNRFLNGAHWGIMLMLTALLIGVTEKNWPGRFEFWGVLVSGATCFAYWMYKKLSQKSESNA